jgi:hypothetical protein
MHGAQFKIINYISLRLGNLAKILCYLVLAI